MFELCRWYNLNYMFHNLNHAGNECTRFVLTCPLIFIGSLEILLNMTSSSSFNCCQPFSFNLNTVYAIRTITDMTSKSETKVSNFIFSSRIVRK